MSFVGNNMRSTHPYLRRSSSTNNETAATAESSRRSGAGGPIRANTRPAATLATRASRVGNNSSFAGYPSFLRPADPRPRPDEGAASGFRNHITQSTLDAAARAPNILLPMTDTQGRTQSVVVRPYSRPYDQSRPGLLPPVLVALFQRPDPNNPGQTVLEYYPPITLLNFGHSTRTSTIPPQPPVRNENVHQTNPSSFVGPSILHGANNRCQILQGGLQSGRNSSTGGGGGGGGFLARGMARNNIPAALPSVDRVREALRNHNSGVPATFDRNVESANGRLPGRNEPFGRTAEATPYLDLVSSDDEEEDDDEMDLAAAEDIALIHASRLARPYIEERRSQIEAAFRATLYSQAIQPAENSVTDSAHPSSSSRSQIAQERVKMLISYRMTELLRNRKYQPKEGDLCPICFEGLVTGECPIKLDCSHCFHIGCIKEWLDIKNICPSCRAVALN
ncbi:OLC1v1001731C1 [Oldenlandia corymbosa var. corymbosa]|uniref:RING-type E3 ubiquitin transferase n=1 Tax=Oldenlandia corymbosa var. corymbosa TaxID=529605 RepID=A0AAV1D897_OLDCO|nr:OLC1v1001731C1 [Oldenlandia corymbosa var. corymbosa]